MGSKKEYKIKGGRGPFIRALKVFLKIFKRKPEIVNLSGGELADRALYLSNHAGANAPLTIELYFPKLLTGWGTYQMFGNVKERWRYLYHVFYRQKLHWNKARAFIVATLFAPISIRLYRGVGLIPTYPDGRFIASVKTTCRVLEAGHPILIYPENSEEGYADPPTSFNAGFAAMAKVYKRIRGEDLPVYCVYLLKRPRKLVIAPPIYVNQLAESGLSDEEICRVALETMKSVRESALNKNK